MADIYLTTAYRDREQVKSLGARWDAGLKKWYVPSGRDLAVFAAWLPVEAPTAAYGAAQTELAVAEVSSPTAPLSFVQKGVALSALLAAVAQAVAQAYRSGVWTMVEVVKADARRGHVYLELAERSASGEVLAQARAMIWADTANQIVPAFERATGVVLGAGIKLLVRARPTMHAIYGLSLVVDAIDPDYTLGDLEARKREIRELLQRQGLFDANRQLAQPWDYQSVVVVAPEGAAGLGDFRAEASRLEQLGLCHFRYVYSRFQGEGAAAEILRALVAASQRWQKSTPPDAVVIIRGGGAVNDLAWLNDYALARFICEAAVPVLTGIGHERDSTVLDEVANIRFDTPSKVIAGIEQVIVRRSLEAKSHFEHIALLAGRASQSARAAAAQLNAQLEAGALRQITLARERSEDAMARLRVTSLQAIRSVSDNTRDRFFDIRHLADEQVSAARQTVPALLAEVRFEARQGLRGAGLKAQVNFDAVVERAGLACRHAGQGAERALTELAAAARAAVADASAQVDATMREIAGQGPEKTLSRGFAIVRNADGATVTGAASTGAAGKLEIQFHDGRLAVSLDPAPGETP
jgi:exodeoxyribonuclease VII large subunit